ncbi:MAG: DUF192 domain-containing protein [Acidobacteriota bacterium]|nr:DUF192 domain-containing protein [Acidobacteriota bacterium]
MKGAMVMLLLFACTQPGAQPAATTSATAPAATTTGAASGPHVIFPDGYVVHVELATDDETRAQGLMYRNSLRPGTGMLFLFAEDGDYPFWMKNTLIPLDMVWIDSSQRVAHVKVNVPPCKVENCPSYPPNVTSRYVLEVAGGVAQQHGLKPGDQLRFVGTGNVAVR